MNDSERERAMERRQLRDEQEVERRRLCPECGSFARHSGYLHQETPDSERLDPPVQILRCYECRISFRIDGAPYDETAWARRKAELAG